MSRRLRHLAGAASLTLVLLVIAATAVAKPVVPAVGQFSGSAVSASAPGQMNVTYKVTKAGGKARVEVTITPLSLTCQVNGGAFPLTSGAVSTKLFKQGGNGAPLAVKNGKFSYKGAIYGGPTTAPGKAEITGTFKSPKKVVGSAKFSWEALELVPGQSAPCESGKLTLAA
jgi:hypothetical protein